MLSLVDARRSYQPKIPLLLQRPCDVAFKPIEQPIFDSAIIPLFPLTSQNSVIQGRLSSLGGQFALSRIGAIFSGGPAPGGHNVVAGIFDTLQKMRKENQLIGFLGGPQALTSGLYKELKKEEIDNYRNLGGFDLLGSGRTKVETPQQFKDILDVTLKLKLDGLIIIGGDDSNTNAAHLAEYFLQKQSSTCVIGVPKTIDGDIQNRYVPITFGFDTASKVYSEMIGNLACDTLSSLKYYHFIKLMGRSASHLTLECALKTHPNIALIAEERKPLQQVIDELVDWIEARHAQQTPYGIVLVPEGLLEAMPDIGPLIQRITHRRPEELTGSLLSTWAALPERIQKQLLLEKDSHGNINLSAIDTEVLLIESIQKQLAQRHFQGSFQPVSHFYGYEGRCSHPSNFDANYSYALGCCAALLASHRFTGMMAYIQQLHKSPMEWTFGGVPLPSLLKLQERKGLLRPVIDKALVDVEGTPFKRFFKQRNAWKLHSDYQNVGPIQYAGDEALTDSFPLILPL